MWLTREMDHVSERVFYKKNNWIGPYKERNVTANKSYVKNNIGKKANILQFPLYAAKPLT